jgi:hypothetical protein
VTPVAQAGAIMLAAPADCTSRILASSIPPFAPKYNLCPFLKFVFTAVSVLDMKTNVMANALSSKRMIKDINSAMPRSLFFLISCSPILEAPAHSGFNLMRAVRLVIFRVALAFEIRVYRKEPTQSQGKFRRFESHSPLR